MGTLFSSRWENSPTFLQVVYYKKLHQVTRKWKYNIESKVYMKDMPQHRENICQHFTIEPSDPRQKVNIDLKGENKMTTHLK